MTSAGVHSLAAGRCAVTDDSGMISRCLAKERRQTQTRVHVTFACLWFSHTARPASSPSCCAVRCAFGKSLSLWQTKGDPLSSHVLVFNPLHYASTSTHLHTAPISHQHPPATANVALLSTCESAPPHSAICLQRRHHTASARRHHPQHTRTPRGRHHPPSASQRRTQARVYVFVPRARLCTRSAA